MPASHRTCRVSLCRLSSDADRPAPPERGRDLPATPAQAEETSPAGTRPAGAQPERPQQPQQPIGRHLHAGDGEDGEGEGQTGFRN